MKKRLNQTILYLFLFLLVFSNTQTVIENITFSEEYDKLLASVDKNAGNSKKCYQNDTKVLIEDIITNSEKSDSNGSNESRGQVVRVVEIVQVEKTVYKDLQSTVQQGFTSLWTLITLPWAWMVRPILQWIIQPAIVIFQQTLYLVYSIFYDLWQFLIFDSTCYSKKQYVQNFANINGGAMILSISSSKIRAAHALLQQNNDRYMYTDADLPLQIVVALKEEVSIDRIVIKSNQYYSSTINQFVVFGAFALDKNGEKMGQNWFKVVQAKAKNIAVQQDFRTVNKVIRFLKIRILSAYGDWKYFTMTQIKVYGNSLYAEAMNDYSDGKNVASEEVQPQVDTQSMQLYDDLQKMIMLARDGNRTIPQNNLIKYFFQELEKLSKLEQKQILYMSNLTQKIQALQNLTIMNSGNSHPSHNQSQTLKQKLIKPALAKQKYAITDYLETHCLPHERLEVKSIRDVVGDIVEQAVENSEAEEQKFQFIGPQNRRSEEHFKSDHYMKEQLELLTRQINELNQNKSSGWSQTTLIFVSVLASFIVTAVAFLLIFLFLYKNYNQTKTTWTSTTALSQSSSIDKLVSSTNIGVGGSFNHSKSTKSLHGLEERENQKDSVSHKGGRKKNRVKF